MAAAIIDGNTRLPYGAREIKAHASRRTLSAFGIALCIFIAFACLFYLVPREQVPESFATISITPGPITPVSMNESIHVPPAKAVAAGEAARPVVPDLPAEPFVPAVIDESFAEPSIPVEPVSIRDVTGAQGSANTREGNASVAAQDGSKFGAKEAGSAKPVLAYGIPDSGMYDDPWHYAGDVTLPEIDLAALQGKIVYPEIAVRSKIEGKVSIRVLLDNYGHPVKYVVEYTENELFVKPATGAIMSSRFQPAKNALGRNVYCWVSIPVVFRLR